MQLLPLLRAIGDLAHAEVSPARFLEALCLCFESDCAALSLNDQGKESYFISESKLPHATVEEMFSGLDGVSPMIISDLREEKAFESLRDSLAGEDVQALVMTPILENGHRLGRLLLIYGQPRSLTVDERDALDSVSTQLGLILARRRDRQQLQERIAALEEQVTRRRAAEEKLQNESELIQLLQEVAAQANEAKNFKEALRFAVARICEYTKWPLGHVFWLEDGTRLEMVSSGIWHCSLEGEITEFRTATAEMRLVPGTGRLGEVMSTGVGGWRTLSKDDDLARIQQAETLGLVSSYTYPVKVEDRVFAVLEFFSPAPEKPSDSLIEAMDFVANQLGQVVRRQETQVALVESERRFRAIFNQTFQFIGLCRPDGTLIEANEAVLVFGGVEREDVLDKPLWETPWWQTSKLTQERLRKAVAEAAEGNFVRYEEEIAGAKGATAIIDFSLKPVFDAEGRVVLLIPEGRDITRLKSALDRLRRNEMLLAEAQRVAQLGSWEWEIATGHLTWSDELYRIYGVTREDFTPTYENFLLMVHPQDRDSIDAIVQAAYRRQEPFDYYHRIVRRDGIVRTLHARGDVVVDGDGTTKRMYGTGQDVTDQRQIEEALRKSEESYRTLARNIPDAIVALYDQELNLILLEGNIPENVSALIANGFSLPDGLPADVSEERVQPFYAALEGNPQVFEREYEGATYLVQTVPVYDDDGQIFAGIAMAQDITSRKENEQKLIQRAQQLSALHEMGQTVAGSLDLEVVFNRVLETLRPLLNAEGVFVLLREGAETLVFAAANEVGVGSLAGQRVPATRGVAGDVIRTGELHWLRGDETLQRVYYELQEVAHYHPRAIIAAPMTIHGELIGVMEAVHSHPEAFGEDEKAMMETAANWVAIAIGNARQHGRLQHQFQESEALATISRALSQTLDLDRILQLIVNSARELMPRADWSIFYFLHENETRRLEPVAIAGLEPSATDDDAVSSATRILLHSFAPSEPESTTSKPGEVAELIKHTTEDGALVAAPVQGREGLIGILSVQTSTADGFTGDDQRLLSMLGRQAAMAVDNARLFNDQQRARRAADTLRAANVALSQSLELPIVLDTLLDYARELIGFDYGLVLLARRDGALAVEAMHGLPSADDLSLAIEREAFSELSALIHGRAGLVLNQLPAGMRRALPSEIIDNSASWLIIPMLAADSPAGLLVLGHREPNAYGERRSRLGEGLAAQATIAIQNARLFAEVQSNQERLRQLSRQIVNAQEKERQRVSRELHDEAGQALTALKISLEMIVGSWPDIPEFVGDQMDEAIEMTDHTMEQIRLLAHDLRPPVLDTFGLSTSVEGLARDFGRRTGLQIKLNSEPLPDLPDAVAISFYRFVQEALTNVARHADATQVGIELRRDRDKIILSVEDNGRGFDVNEVIRASGNRAGIGLVGMQDRFELLKGWIEIDSEPEQGTTVRACVPHEEGE